MPPLDLDGQVAIVTGAGRNIGREVSHRLAAAGAAVALVDLEHDSATAVAREIEEATPGARVLPVTADVTDPEDVAGLVERTRTSLGPPTILVNNVAATDRGQTVLDLTLREWHRVFDACVTSAFLCSQRVAREMVEHGLGGCIVNVGSTSAALGRDNALAYPMAKSALVGLTRSMAVQLGPYGIRVNLVIPNVVGSPVGQATPSGRTPRNLLGRPAVPADIATAVRFLVSPDAGFVTGTELLVDGGATLAGAATSSRTVYRDQRPATTP